MSKDPAFLFYSSDFLTGTYTMTDEQVGKYIRLLCLQHQRGHLLENHMVSVCKTYDEAIYGKFIQDDEGRYYNERLEQEVEKRVKFNDSRRLNGMKGGRPKQENGKLMKTTRLASENLGENENDNENKDDNIPYKEIIEYLNLVAKTKFRTDSEKTKALIKARFNDKFTKEDFFSVIDVKCADWIGNEHEKYLRPETLFGTKFEGYLNQKKPTNNSSQYELKEISKGVFKI